jgi:hypothetical protein
MSSVLNSINVHAEELCSTFVQRNEKMELEASQTGTRYALDFGALSQKMTTEMDKNVRISLLRPSA